MHILFVTPYVPSRIRVRPFHFIRMLAREHTISLVGLVCDEYERALADEVREYCASVELVTLPKWHAYANCLQALPTTTPLRVAYYRSAQLVQRMRQVIEQQHIDVVHGELIKTVPALRQLRKQQRVPLVYDAVDCISSYLEQQWRSAKHPLQKTFIYTELKKMQQYEPHVLSQFDQVIITSEYDRRYLLRAGLSEDRVHVVPNGVDTEYFTPPIGSREADSLVFCAKMDYYPNAQAMLYFCQEILPRIWAHRPQVRLTIVGNNPPPAIQALSVDKRIHVTGYVPDIRPYLSKASLALAPLQVAAGMQNKVLEALAAATPLVATPAACRALQLEDGRHLLIADGVQPYADAVLRLLADPQTAQRLGEHGRHYVEERHSWLQSVKDLSYLYQQASQAYPHPLTHETLLGHSS